MAAKDNPGLPVDFMGVDRVSLVASERDRDDRSKLCDDPGTLSAAPFQTKMTPPVAMSLRTRESSSLALKHIFDQINASAENPQPLESLLGRTAGMSDNRDDNGKRDGPVVLKELSGMIRSAGLEPDVWQRTGGPRSRTSGAASHSAMSLTLAGGSFSLFPSVSVVEAGVHGPRKPGLEDRNSFHFKSYSAGWGEEVKGQQVNRGTPQSFAEREHSRWQPASEKDLRYCFRSPERTVSPLLQDACGDGEDAHKASQEELANDSPQSRGIASRPQDVHLRKRLPELDLSFQKTNCQDPAAFLPTQTAFGSPISAPSHQSLSDNPDVHNSKATWSIHGIQQGSLPQAASRPSTVSTPGRQATAQLTIFYSGRVNVYDDVPADKANAIMLLAGNGNSWSTNFRTPPPPERERSLRVMSPPATQPPVAVPANVVSGTVGTTPAKTFTPSVTANSSPGPSTTPAAPPTDPKPQTPAKRSHTGIELPHARKASLARFLEKRKDRVQLKPQVGGEGQENGELGSERPCSPKKQRSARSRSPSPTRSVHGDRGNGRPASFRLSDS